MNILDGLFVVQRSIPTDVLGGLATGQYSLHGGVVRDGAGQIVRHLVSTTSGTGLNPFGLLSVIPSLVNVYQLNELKNMTMALMQISQATMLMSGLNLAVGVAGFAALKASLNKVDERIKELDQKIDWVKVFLAAERRGKLLNAIKDLSRLPDDQKLVFEILFNARHTLGEARMCYLQHWDESKSLDESMSYQHFYCTAFLAQARCSAELGMHDIALQEFQEGMENWRERACNVANEKILRTDRARYLEARYVDQVPAAKLAGWLDFASGEVRGFQWIDEMRRQHVPSLISTFWSSKLSKDEQRDIGYLDNLASRDSVLRGYEAQLQFMSQHGIKPSVFADEVGRLGEHYGDDVVLVLESTQAQGEQKERQLSLLIDKAELLRQLAKEETDATSKGRFVGLSWFVKTHLAKQGYAIDSAYGLVNAMEDEGSVEIYKVDNASGGYPVTAVRIARSAA